ncbi:MAG: twin-arginine translocase subunit TatC [Chloroflexota bacterium]|nr:twin-arginine translocase subunit TatC [Chloroflexota bacterium]
MAITKKERQTTIVEIEGSETRVTTTESRRGLQRLRRRDKKPKKPKEQPTAGQMTFFQHLGELRNRIIWSCLAVLAGSIIGFIYSRDLVGIFADLVKPYKLITTNVVDQFTIYMNLAIYVGLLLASPVIVYQIMAFLAPALEPESTPGTPEYEQELKTLKSIRHSLWFFIPFVAVSFAAGLAFSYYLVIPQAIHFLSNFSQEQIELLPEAQKFIGLVTGILFWSGVTFEVPIVLFLLAKIKVVTYKRLIKWWKWALVLSLVAAAFITPSPDVFNQAVIAVPVFGLYWLGVLLARFA